MRPNEFEAEVWRLWDELHMNTNEIAGKLRPVFPDVDEAVIHRTITRIRDRNYRENNKQRGSDMSLATEKVDIITPRDKAKALVAEVVAQYGCTYGEVMSGCRHRGGGAGTGTHHVQRKMVVQARWAAMRRVRDEYGWSTVKIGKMFGRDYSSVMFALGMLPKKKRQPYIPSRFTPVFHGVVPVDDGHGSVARESTKPESLHTD